MDPLYDMVQKTTVSIRINTDIHQSYVEIMNGSFILAMRCLATGHETHIIGSGLRWDQWEAADKNIENVKKLLKNKYDWLWQIK